MFACFLFACRVDLLEAVEIRGKVTVKGCTYAYSPYQGPIYWLLVTGSSSEGMRYVISVSERAITHDRTICKGYPHA